MTKEEKSQLNDPNINNPIEIEKINPHSIKSGLYFLLILVALGMFLFAIGEGKTTVMDMNYHYERIKVTKIQFDLLKDSLLKYNAENNRYPNNNECLGVLQDLVIENYQYNDDISPWKKFRKSGSIILSHWEVPYIYENRRGQNADKFRHSPINNDKEDMYSMKVYDDIYIASSGAEYTYNKIVSLGHLKTFFEISILILFIGCLVLTILFIKHTGQTRLAPLKIFGVLIIIGYTFFYSAIIVIFGGFLDGHMIRFDEYIDEIKNSNKIYIEKSYKNSVINKNTYDEYIKVVNK